MKGRLVVLVLVALVGCDTPPNPAPFNPYDPDFEGIRQVSQPTGLRVAATSPTSVTLTWDDVSSFESGYRIQIRTSPDGSYIGAMEVPPDVTTATVTGLTDLRPHTLRVVAFHEGGPDSEPSVPVGIRYPREDHAGYAIGAGAIDGPAEFLYALEGLYWVAATGNSGRVPGVERSDDLEPDVLTTRTSRLFLVAEDTGGLPALRVVEQARDVGLVTLGDGPTALVGDIATDPEGAVLGVWDGATLRVLDVASGTVVHRAPVSRFGRAALRSLTTDGQVALLSETHGAPSLVPMRAVDSATGQIVWATPPELGYTSARVLPDGETVLAIRSRQQSGRPSGLEVLDVRTGAVVRTGPDLPHGQILGVAGDGATAVYTGGGLTIVDLSTLAPYRVVASGARAARPLPNRRGVVYAWTGPLQSGDRDTKNVTTVRFDANWEPFEVGPE